uniref:Uncharacterized protein n=1 Tax=Rhizophora mucronata TaxID=61149 RepID=A0A2P2QMY5_RHIMU
MSGFLVLNPPENTSMTLFIYCSA